MCYSLWYKMLPAGGTVKEISDNEIYLLIKYIKSVLWRVAKCLSYIEDARCPKVKVPSYNYCCSGKSISTTYSECVFVTLGIQHPTRMYHIVVCGLPGSTVYFYIIA